MNKLHQNKPVLFAVLWIVIYVVSLSLADSASAALGLAKSVTLPFSLLLVLVLFSWIRCNHLENFYGFRASSVPASRLLWYIPLGLLVSVNLWLGAVMNYSLAETLLYVSSMFCVGFLEEVIFRGLLFRALLPGGMKSAVLISSLTFGIGHLVNLFNSSGADLFASVLQVFYAVAIGFLFTILFLRTGSLYACILTHGIFNALSVFANESARTPEIDILSAAFLTVTALAYAVYILRKTPSNQL